MGKTLLRGAQGRCAKVYLTFVNATRGADDDSESIMRSHHNEASGGREWARALRIRPLAPITPGLRVPDVQAGWICGHDG